ncbi:Protein prenyltransferase alpha subunit repeat-containing protein 1 [Colletotrichum siamense]|nr:Protein prenyltransferase alpha subunit repeat-containing protein 1 [Colletotrichum siamense]
MSRALDKHVIAALKQGDHQKIFNEIAGLFENPHDERLLEIEILGRSHPISPEENFLRDDNAVAVPKLRLVQAFVVARQILQNHLADGTVGAEKLRLATGALLLMDPEHLTAANTRKRLLWSEMSAGGDVRSALMQEKWFVDSLLTSRLHRHTKSPTLWNHRRWLLERFRELGLPVAIQQDVEAVIMIAGERHPRNYYAWGHARWLTKTFETAFSSEDIFPLIQSVKRWSFRHHTDISGWSFLAHLLGESRSNFDNQVFSSVFKETLDLAESLRWENESVWWFLRTTASNTAMGQAGLEQFVNVQEKLSAAAPVDSTGFRVLSAARKWCDMYGPHGDGVIPSALEQSYKIEA